MWNERYAGTDFLFGTEPARFLTTHAHRLPDACRVLCVADGEGRNSTYLATLGHAVTAFDPAANALTKARKLNADRAVSVAYDLADLESWDWRPAAFDAVAAIFIQFSAPPERVRAFARIAETIRPGGLLLLHGYARRQIDYKTGGPPLVDNLYTLPLLAESFAGWEILHEADYDAEIAEGTAHVGRSALIDFIAQKPA